MGLKCTNEIVLNDTEFVTMSATISRTGNVTAVGKELQDEQFLTSEKAMAPHSSTLAWKIPWMEEPGRLQSTGSLRVRHD